MNPKYIAKKWVKCHFEQQDNISGLSCRQAQKQTRMYYFIVVHDTPFFINLNMKSGKCIICSIVANCHVVKFEFTEWH